MAKKKIALGRVAKNTPGFSVGKVEDKMGFRWMVAEMATELEAARQLMFSAAAIKDKGENHTLQASIIPAKAGNRLCQRVSACRHY